MPRRRWERACEYGVIAGVLFVYALLLLALVNACTPNVYSTVTFFEELDERRGEVSKAMLLPPPYSREEAIARLDIQHKAYREYIRWLESLDVADPEIRTLITHLVASSTGYAIGLQGVRDALASGNDEDVWYIEQAMRANQLATIDLVRSEINLRLRLGVPIPMIPDA